MRIRVGQCLVLWLALNVANATGGVELDGSSVTLRAYTSAIAAGEWEQLGEILNRAHLDRLRLSPNITTPQMDDIIETAMSSGAIAPKVCGAGGGGCIAFYCEDGRRQDVEAALAGEAGARVLDWAVDPDGLKLSVT